MASIIIAIVAAIGTLGTAIYQYRAERSRTAAEADIGRETLIDARINAHLTRLDQEVEQLQTRNLQLEQRMRHMQDQLDAAIAYVRLNGLAWPPPDDWPTPPDGWHS